MLTPQIIDLAEELAGNHRSFESFGWGNRPINDHNYCIVNTSTRDSGLLDASNEHAILEALEPYLGSDRDAWTECHSHWAVGYVNALIIRVYDESGAITPAFTEYAKCALALADYPVLDESDYSERGHNALCDNIERAIGYYGRKYDVDIVPLNIVDNVYRWLADHMPGELEDDGQDQGACPSADAIYECMVALGYGPTEDEEIAS